MNPYDLPASVVQAWFKRLSIRSVEAMPPGFSGAMVLRCSDADDVKYAVKRWPLGTTPERVLEVHHVVAQARQFGCELLPHFVQASSGSTLVVNDNECWEMSTWSPGQTLPFDATPSQIADGAAAIASFHRASIAITPPEFVNRHQPNRVPGRMPSPTIAIRLRRLEQLQRELPKALITPLPEGLSSHLSETLENARQLLRNRWARNLPKLVHELNSRLAYTVDTQYVLRDIHREHILFDEHSVGHTKAIIDFDAIQFDCASVDLARWVGSFRDLSGSKHINLDAAVAGYRQDWRFSDEQMLLARALLVVSPWVNLGNWVAWIVLGTRKFANDELAIASRISELVDQITGDF